MDKTNYAIFENTVKYIQDTLDMLDKVGKANPQGDHPADLNISVLIVGEAIREKKRPKGCPADYNLDEFFDLVDLENALRARGAGL